MQARTIIVAAVTVCLCAAGARGASLADNIWVSWGWNYFGQCDVPGGLGDAQSVVSGYGHNVALKADGSLVAWGYGDVGQCDVPAGSNYTAVGVGSLHNLAIKTDGTAVAWGGVNRYGELNVPAGSFTQVAAGWVFSVGLKADGSLAAWGQNDIGQCNVPAGTNFTRIACGDDFGLAVRSDGSLVRWGNIGNVPAGNDFAGIAGAINVALAIRQDGSLVAWGNDQRGQISGLPAGNGFIQVDGGYFHCLALRSDGTLAAWGQDEYGLVTNTPTSGFCRAISVGEYHNLALMARATYDGLVVNGAGAAATVDREVTVSGDVTVQTMLEMAGNNAILRTNGTLTVQPGGGVRGAGMLIGNMINQGTITPTARFVCDRTVDIGAEICRILSNTAARMNSGQVHVSGGTIFVPNGLELLGTSRLEGGGFVRGSVWTGPSAEVFLEGNMEVGDPASIDTSYYRSEGLTEVNGVALTILGSFEAATGSRTTLAGGVIKISGHQSSIFPGGQIDGYGEFHGPPEGSSSRWVTNDGSVHGVRLSAMEAFCMRVNVNGSGSFRNVIFAHKFSPGHSAIRLEVGDIGLEETAELVMELGGLSGGSQYDQLTTTGTISLGGTLTVDLIDGFVPQLGNSFDLFDGQVAGTFDAMQLPALGGGLSWDTSDLYTGGTITVTPEPATLSLLALGACLPLCRRRSRRGLAVIRKWKNK